MVQGGHKNGKHGKPEQLREFEKLLKSQGNLREIFYLCRKTWKTQRKCKVCHIIVNENAFQGILLVFLREKFENTLEIFGKTQGIYFLKNMVTLTFQFSSGEEILVKVLGVNALLPILCRLRFSKSFQSNNHVYRDLNNRTFRLYLVLSKSFLR